jgi:erythromycin esterase
MDPTDQLRAVAIPLAGADPALPEDDLAPLLERLAGARLIGLGEATHGDHESLAFKCRLIQALVRRGRCDVVIFERGVAEMDAYDRYVTGADDDLPMGNELYPWQVEEVRDLFVWLRAWNAGHAPDNAVRVAGMDMQSPAGLPLALRLLGEAGTVAPAAWRRLAAEVGQRQNDVGWLEGARAAWQATGRPPLAPDHPHGRWLALLVQTFGQWLDFWTLYRRREGTPFEDRNRYMAVNTLAQLERFGKGATGVIWAHTLHLYCDPEPSPAQGMYLRSRLGTAYRTVSFAFGQGSFNAGSQRYNTATRQPEGPIDWALRPHTALPPPPGATEHLLDQLRLDCFAVVPTEVEWLRHAPLIRTYGAYYWAGAGDFPDRRVAGDVYDVLVYFREVRPSRLLGTVT